MSSKREREISAFRALAQQVHEGALEGALDRACPYCGAPPDEACVAVRRTKKGWGRLKRPHAERLTAAVDSSAPASRDV